MNSQFGAKRRHNNSQQQFRQEQQQQPENKTSELPETSNRFDALRERSGVDSGK